MLRWTAAWGSKRGLVSTPSKCSARLWTQSDTVWSKVFGVLSFDEFGKLGKVQFDFVTLVLRLSTKTLS